MDAVAVISASAPQSAIDSLRSFCRVLLLPADELLPSPVASHADMILCEIGGKIVVHRSYYEAHADVVDDIAALCTVELVLTGCRRGASYPDDVALNAAVGEDYIVCRSESTASEILSLAESSGRRVLQVKQGYAGCSTVVMPGCAVTSDTSIHRVLTEAGVDALYADKSGVVLPGYDCGFIGGCGGFYGGAVYFTGALGSIGSGKAVRQFIEEHGYSVIELTSEPLYDCGGIKFFTMT